MEAEKQLTAKAGNKNYHRTLRGRRRPCEWARGFDLARHTSSSLPQEFRKAEIAFRVESIVHR
jgi:hypothetical protein